MINFYFARHQYLILYKVDKSNIFYHVHYVIYVKTVQLNDNADKL